MEIMEKHIYIPRKNNIPNNKFDKLAYQSQAYKEIILKRRTTISNFKKEIDRRQAKNYGLD